MSSQTKRPHAEVLPVAERIVAWLAPSCERIVIAGSLRRRRPTVGDIEIVAIATPELNLFGEPTDKTLIDYALHDTPKTLDGQRMKQFQHDDCKVDLFLPTPENWGYILMLRTGPEQFSHRMVTPAWQGGKKPNDLTLRDGYVYRGGTLLPVHDEETLFALWGIEYVPPEERG